MGYRLVYSAFSAHVGGQPLIVTLSSGKPSAKRMFIREAALFGRSTRYIRESSGSLHCLNWIASAHSWSTLLMRTVY